MQTIFTKGSYASLQSGMMILENIHKVEQLLAVQVITPEQEKLLLERLKTHTRLARLEAILRRLLTIITLGIYALLT